MAESHVISALVKKYQVIYGQLQACEAQAATYQGQLDNIRATIRLFEPAYDTKHIQPKRPMRLVLRPKMFMRSAMDVMREAGEPMTAEEITRKAFLVLSTEPGEAIITRFSKQLYNALVVREKEGSVIGDGAHPQRWALAK